MNPAHEILKIIQPYLPSDIFNLLNSAEMFAFSLAFIASMGTFVGGLVVVLMGKILGIKGEITKKTSKLIGIFQSFSAGVMLYMTFFDLIPESTQVIGRFQTLLYFFIGIITFLNMSYSIGVSVFALIIFFFPEQEIATETPTKRKTKKRTESTLKDQKANLLRASMFTYMGMLLHNLPEGLSVYLSALADTKLGLQLALGIMLHNIPEGMAVAIPIWAATGSSAYVLWMTFLNGLAEPFGVIIGGLLLKNYLTTEILSKSLAVVAGIMAFISIYELFPSAIGYSGRNMASTSLFLGMFLCFCALESVEYLIGSH